MANPPLKPSSPSGMYVARPSIARFIEEEVASDVSDIAHIEVRLDVLSDHQLYENADTTFGGVFIVTDMPPPVGTEVTLELELPWGEKVDVSGEVSWALDIPRTSLRHRPGMGVRFGVPPEIEPKLERAMRLRSPMVIPEGVRRE
ncbi:MAG: PilZ domain-containing protein [Archangium sp.]|nr:PilZ domain-containing protein [Archangium sp.]